MPTQTRSRPERDIVGFRNSRTTANRSSSDSRHVLRSASATASCAGSGWSEDGGGVRCVAAILNTVALALFPDSLFSGCVAFCQDPRRFITRLNGRPYLWCRCRLAMTSNKYWCLPSEYPPAPILPEKRRTTRVYVIIWDGTLWNCSLQLKECEEDAVLSLLLIFDMSHVVSLEQFRFLGWKGSSAETLKFIRQA